MLVLVLNGGDDNPDDPAAKVAALIPGAVAAVLGTDNHPLAPDDPAYQAELLAFLRARWV